MWEVQTLEEMMDDKFLSVVSEEEPDGGGSCGGKMYFQQHFSTGQGKLSYLTPLGNEKISAPYFKQCFFREGWGVLPPRLNQTPCLPVPRQK
jgi:hypothetical protein